MTPVEKVAAVLIGLGEETAAEVIKHLREDEVEKITGAIASLGTVTSEEIDQALSEFGTLLREVKSVHTGGPDFAREAVERAVGPEKAKRLMGRAAPEGAPVPTGVPAERIALILKKEHPQVIALALSRMDARVAAGALSALPEQLRDDVAYRLATIEDVTPDVIRELDKNLSRELQSLATGGTEVNGAERAAAILNVAGGSVERGVLRRLEAEDPELADRVRQKMFTFEDLADLKDRDLQRLLQNVDRNDLALALKSASDRLKERLLSNLSQRVAAGLKEDTEALGPRRRSEVEEAQLRIVSVGRDLDAAGEISMLRGAGEFV